jgi:hypothetical protein
MIPSLASAKRAERVFENLSTIVLSDWRRLLAVNRRTFAGVGWLSSADTK